jgi:hypothetical protein
MGDHIRNYKTGRTLCGDEEPVRKRFSLYKGCPNCNEIARNLLAGCNMSKKHLDSFSSRIE